MLNATDCVAPLGLMLVFAISAAAQERTQARSMVITGRGIVATSQTLASQAGAQVLARGGSAVDAAIAANAVLHVVEPMSNGMGGDLFALYWDAKAKKLTGLNASGWAPKGLTIDYLKKTNAFEVPDKGIHSVTVPGCVEGWEKLHKRFGKLPLAEVLQPAIYYAENGFPVTEIIQDHWRGSVFKLSSDPNAAKVFLKNGEAPEVGDVFRNPGLAKAFRLIGQNGAAAFYRGPIANAILRTSARLRGTLDASDLAEYEAEWVDAISTTYRGWTVYELPPNSQGVAALQMLNLMERFPIGNMSAADALHIKIEAQKLAYRDLEKYVGDPRFGRVPVPGLLAKSYAEDRALLIQKDRASCAPPAGVPVNTAGDTIYLSAVDSEGNIVSFIQSLYLNFGSGVVVDDYGFHLHNRAGLFSMDAKHPNALAPRKRPFHTIIPGFMQKESISIGFGIMGGFNQAQAHAQFVSNVVDHNMNIQAALEAPRFTKLTFGGCDVRIESRVPQDVRNDLEARGHNFEVLGAYSGMVGGGQAVMHDTAKKVNFGASSPRKDGAAVPEPDPYWNQAVSSTKQGLKKRQGTKSN
jgi:gamma-glutamyltranspeptidase / glutathione hydrolase